MCVCIDLFNTYSESKEDDVSAKWTLSQKASEFLGVRKSDGDHVLSTECVDSMLTLGNCYIQTAKEILHNVHNKLEDISFLHINTTAMDKLSDNSFQNMNESDKLNRNDKYGVEEVAVLVARKENIFSILQQEKTECTDLKFKTLAQGTTRRTAAICFYALLELHQEGKAKLTQDEDINIILY